MRIVLRRWQIDSSAASLSVLDVLYKEAIRANPNNADLKLDYGVYLLFAKRDNASLLHLLNKFNTIRKKMTVEQLYGLWTIKYLRQHYVGILCVALCLCTACRSAGGKIRRFPTANGRS